MKKHLRSIIFSVLAISASVLSAFAQEDITQTPSCKYCGMDRSKYNHSRMLIEFDDKSSLGTCSLHCAAVDLAVTIDKTPVAILVADYNSKKLIDAEKAVWVIGGSKPGVMTRQPKWAFASQPDAEAFIKENGGKLAQFEEAIKLAYEDMYQDTRMIREKRKMKRNAAMEQHKH